MTDIVTWLRSILNVDRSVELRCREAADLIEQLREERDEARRMYCVMLDQTDGLECQDWAQRKGWDCFNDEADHNNQLFRKTDGE